MKALTEVSLQLSLSHGTVKRDRVKLNSVASLSLRG
jgi:hypothetical protein